MLRKGVQELAAYLRSSLYSAAIDAPDFAEKVLAVSLPDVKVNNDVHAYWSKSQHARGRFTARLALVESHKKVTAAAIKNMLTSQQEKSKALLGALTEHDQ